MITSPQIIRKNDAPEYVVLPYKEYKELTALLEDHEDILAIKEFHESDQKTIPHAALKKIAEGENAVKVFCELRNMSQFELAENIGVSRQYIFQIENNDRSGSAKVIKKIAQALDVDMELLV